MSAPVIVALVLIELSVISLAIWVWVVTKNVDWAEKTIEARAKSEHELWDIQINEVNENLAKRVGKIEEAVAACTEIEHGLWDIQINKINKQVAEIVHGVWDTQINEVNKQVAEIVQDINTVGPRVRVSKWKSDVEMREEEVSDERPEGFE